MPMLTFYIFYQHTKLGDSHFNRFGDMIVGMKIKKGRVTPTTPLLGVICHS